MKNYSRKKVNGKRHPWELTSIGSFIYPPQEKKSSYLWKNSQTSNTHALYTFDVANVEEDFLLKETNITFP